MNAGDLFSRARAAGDFLQIASAVKLVRVGRRLRGECPLCGASKGKKGSGAFSADPVSGYFRCWACDARGDVIDLEHKLHGRPGEGLIAAAQRILGESGPVPRTALPNNVRERPAREGGSNLTNQVASDLSFASCLNPETVLRYLAGRGIDGPVARAAAGTLRYHPEAYWGRDGQTNVRLPAIIAKLRAAEGFVGGVHVTYLAGDGRGKTRRIPAKRMWGRQSTAEGAPGAAWLIGPEMDWAGGSGPLVVGEGIESTLSAAILLGVPCRAAATLSLGRLQGGWLRDRFGRVDPSAVAADPASPPFTWPSPPASPWPAVIIAVDRDMGPMRVKVRKFAGGTAEHTLSADERAQICASLAEAAWRKACPELGPRQVRTIAASPGHDFNDELLARASTCSP